MIQNEAPAYTIQIFSNAIQRGVKKARARCLKSCYKAFWNKLPLLA